MAAENIERDAEQRNFKCNTQPSNILNIRLPKGLKIEEKSLFCVYHWIFGTFSFRLDPKLSVSNT